MSGRLSIVCKTPITQTQRPLFFVTLYKLIDMQTISLDARIVSTPDIMGGEPRLEGRRIRVKDIVMWVEYLGQSPDEISSTYDIPLADIFAALAYYHANQAELRHRWDEQETLVEELKAQYPSRLPKT